MASSSGAVNKITKFNGRNYALWKHLIKRFLESEGFYKVVFDEKFIPDTDDEKKAWMAADKQAKDIILSYLDSKHIKLIEGCEHSRDIIDKLDTAYGQKNLIQKMCAQENFQSYRMRSSDTMAEHVAKVEELAEKIREAGGEISNVMIMAKILGSLSRKFRPLRELWLTPSKENDTLEDLKAGLIKEESLILESERLGKIPVPKTYHHHSHHRKPYSSYHHKHKRAHSSMRYHREDAHSSK